MKYEPASKFGGIPLDAGACILDEQPDHITVMIRLPKAAIRDHHAFMAALSERCGATLPAAPPSAVRARRIRGAALACGGAVLAALIFLPAGLLSSAAEAPTQILAYHLDTPEVPVGGVVSYSYVVRRPRSCRTEVDRVISKDGSSVYTTHQYGAAHNLETRPFTGHRLVELPPHLGPGSYSLKMYVIDQCSATEWHQVASPDLPFEIISKN